MLGPVRVWEDLDNIWVGEEDEENWGAVEEFFSYLYKDLAGNP